jgi:putative SOS response-associated peptidase YedK
MTARTAPPLAPPQPALPSNTPLPMPGVFPDYPAPVVRNVSAEREMVLMRSGMPPPPRAGGYPVTNIRNTSSPHWRAWLKPETRCLVPANSFSEYAPEPNPGPFWFFSTVAHLTLRTLWDSSVPAPDG